MISRPPRFLHFHPLTRRIFRPVSPEETIAICFCGPAKTTGLGIPLLYAMWTPVDLFTKAQTSVPVLLYTTEQVCVAHFMVYVFRRWHRRLNHQKRDLEESSVADTDVDANAENENERQRQDQTTDSSNDANDNDHIIMQNSSEKDAPGAGVSTCPDE